MNTGKTMKTYINLYLGSTTMYERASNVNQVQNWLPRNSVSWGQKDTQIY